MINRFLWRTFQPISNLFPVFKHQLNAAFTLTVSVNASHMILIILTIFLYSSSKNENLKLLSTYFHKVLFSNRSQISYRKPKTSQIKVFFVFKYRYEKNYTQHNHLLNNLQNKRFAVFAVFFTPLFCTNR